MYVVTKTALQGVKILLWQVVERDEEMRLSCSLLNVLLDKEEAWYNREDDRIAHARALIEYMGCTRLEECFKGV